MDDGTNYISIRGPSKDLDILEKNVKIKFERFQPTYLFGKYVRKVPDSMFLENLLDLYPRCWIKNEHSTKLGLCGLWIGKYNGEKKHLQILNWAELSEEELSRFS
jgi:hypothetical protein